MVKVKNLANWNFRIIDL